MIREAWRVVMTSILLRTFVLPSSTVTIVGSGLLWDELGRFRPQYLLCAIVLDHLLILLIVEDLVACPHTLPLILVIALIHSALRSIALLIDFDLRFVLFRSSEPARMMLILDGLFVGAPRIISCHKLTSGCCCLFFVNLKMAAATHID